MIERQRYMEAVLRSDLPSFLRMAFPVVVAGERLLWNWHLDAICYHLELVRTRPTVLAVIRRARSSRPVIHRYSPSSTPMTAGR